MSDLPRIAVLVLNWNGADDTLACLQSLRGTTYRNHTVVVIDNGSDDDSVSRIAASNPDQVLLQTGSNLGFAGGNNVGLRWALHNGFDVAVLLNNDTTVAANWLDEFVAAARQLPRGSVLGAKIFYADRPDRVWHFGARWDPQRCRFTKLGRDRVSAELEQVEPVDTVIGCCMWLPRPALERVGLLEEAFFLNYEETDWCFRARAAGIALFSVPGVHVWHKISASFDSQAHNAYFVFRNRRLWIERQFAGKDRQRVLQRMALPEERRVRRRWWFYRLWQALCRLAGTRLPGRAQEKLDFCHAALAGVADHRAQRFGNRFAWRRKSFSGDRHEQRKISPPRAP